MTKTRCTTPDSAALRVSTDEVRRRSRLLAGVRERREHLLDREAAKQMRRDRDAAAVEWRCYNGGDTLHRPEPFLAELAGRNAGRWLEPGAEGYQPIRCGIDADGRVVSARGLKADSEKHFLNYGPDHDELVAMRWDDDMTYGPAVTYIFRDSAGRVNATAEDDGHALYWTQYLYDTEGLLQTTALYVDGRSEPSVIARLTHTPSGKLSTVENSRGTIWDARTHALEEHLPTFAEIVDGLAEPLARAIATSTEEAMRQLSDPIYVLSRAGGDAPEPTAILITRSFVQRKRAEGLGRDDVVSAGYAATGEPGVVDLAPRVLDHLTPDARRRLRQFRQRSWKWSERFSVEYRAVYDWDERPAPMATASQVEVFKLLNGPNGLSPLPVIAWSNPHEHGAPKLEDHGLKPPRLSPFDRSWTLTAATAGIGTVEELWALLNNPRPADSEKSL